MAMRLILLMFLSISLTQIASKTEATEDDSAEKVRQEMKTLFDEFEKGRKTANSRMLKEFDKAIGNVKKAKGLAVEIRAQRIEDITILKKTFDSSQSLPTDDEFIGLSIAYVEAIHRVSIPVRTFFEKALENALENPSFFDELKSVKDRWDATLPGSDQLTGHTNWFGNRTFSNRVTVDFNVHVHRFENGVFHGHLWQEPLNISTKAGMEFDGRVIGNRVVIQTTKMLHGSARQLTLEGFVVERRMVLYVTAINGKRANDPVTLGKR